MGSKERSAAGLDLADHALWVACVAGASRRGCPRERAEHLLHYLATFPTGIHNRAIAEAVELCLDEVDEIGARTALLSLFRSLRDPHFPPLVPTTLPTGHPSQAPA